MKRILSITAFFAMAVIILSSFSLRENPQEPPRGKKVKKHVKLVKVDEEGKKMELDTIIEGDNVFVWKGDTIRGLKELKMLSKEDLLKDMDFDFDFDVEVGEDGDEKVFIMKSGDIAKPIIHELKMLNDSVKAFKIRVNKVGDDEEHDVMIWNGKDDKELIFHAPKVIEVPHLPHAPGPVKIRKIKSGNVIDLSDPGVISFTKKDLKGGKEKITIIREKPSEKEMELHEDIILHGDVDHEMIIHGDHPDIKRNIKVIKSDDGKVEIIDNDKAWSIKKGEKKFITKEGSVVHIKEKEEGDKKEIEVTIEEKEEEKNEK